MRAAVLSLLLPAGFLGALVAEGPGEIAAQGGFVHPVAGVSFPEQAGAFHRTAVTQYDREGLDLSAGYEVRGFHQARIVATFYVYPMGPRAAELRSEFDRCRHDVETISAGTLTIEKDLALAGGAITVRYAAFRIRRPFLFWEEQRDSHLILFPWGGWWLKWRITIPATTAPEPLAAVLGLVEQLIPGDSMVATRGIRLAARAPQWPSRPPPT